MLYSSLMLLDTGVPVMNAMLPPCPASRSHSHLSSRSSHFAADDSCMPRSAEATGTPRFLKWWASSTMSMSTPSDSNLMPASALSSRDSLPSRRRCMAVSALLRAASSRLTVGSLSPLALAAASTAWANSSTRARMFLSRRSLLTCSWLNRLSGTITASQSPLATRPQKRLNRFGVALRVLVHDEDSAGRIEPEHVAGPLVHEVVGDHEHRLGRLAEAFRLVGEGDALERLAGSDDVGDEGSLVAAQGAGHRVLLVGAEPDAVGDAGRGQVGSADVAGAHAVESAVVQGGEPSRAVGVPEHPLVPCVADRVGLLDGGHRGLLVLDPFGLAGRRGLRGGVLGDGDLRVVQARLQQLERLRSSVPYVFAAL